MLDSSKVISFRLHESELAQLKEKALKGESLNQVAQRLLRHLLMDEITNPIPDSTLTELIRAVELSMDSKIVDHQQLLNQNLDAVLSGIAGLQFAFSLTKTANEIEELRKRNKHLEARNQYLQRCLDEAEEEQQDSQAPASQEPDTTKLPDLYAIRDKIIDDWEVKSRKESRRLYYEFANKFIEAIIAADSNYTMLQRLLSDLQQERKNVYAYGQAIANISTEYDTAKKHLRKYERGW